jgi:hypothetical protein
LLAFPVPEFHNPGMTPFVQTENFGCKQCGKATWHSQTVTPINHVLHLLISVLLCGLWLPVWIIFALLGPDKSRWRCNECGTSS